eukprot:TRINITY_DN1843_c0_g3_i1.p1 TRINITY_DN1843_c0_g3~~TRINITY_DN1843_c0_g3_i1.p1  ORF type:complete len:560 (+),score=179.91 TRINITY_DN1843_c0_g3_i1:75-1682(+)
MRPPPAPAAAAAAACCALSGLPRPAAAAALGTRPEQLFVAMGANSTSAVISWATGAGGPSAVRYWTAAADAPNGTATGAAAERYKVLSWLCTMDKAGEPPCDNRTRWEYQSPYLHRARLEGLRPATAYSYSVGPDGGDVTASFTTPPQKGDLTPLKIAVVGDAGQTNYSEQTARDVQRLSAQLLLWVGDMSYADGEGDRWDSWGRMWENVTRQTPTMVLAGNHEIDLEPGTQLTFQHYRARFNMPGSRPEETGPGVVHSWHHYNMTLHYDYGSSYYSFDVGPVHFAVLNTYAPNAPGSKQYQWLRADLDAVDSSVTPWIVVAMHGPFYNSNKKHQGDIVTLEMKANLEAVLLAYGVALVIAGHVHSYERTHPVANDTKVAAGAGPIYVVAGDGGNRQELQDNWDPLPEWSASRNGTRYGYGTLSVQGRRSMTWDWFPIGAPIDSPEDSVSVALRQKDPALIAALDSGGRSTPSPPPTDDSSSGSKVIIAIICTVTLVGLLIGTAVSVVLKSRRTAKQQMAKDAELLDYSGALQAE